MKRRELSDDIIDIIEAEEATPSNIVELLGKFNVGEYCEIPFRMPNNLQNTTAMMRYVERLKQNGLDIGKGDSQFGYKMPLPEKDLLLIGTRYLQIFRRR